MRNIRIFLLLASVIASTVVLPMAHAHAAREASKAEGPQLTLKAPPTT